MIGTLRKGTSGLYQSSGRNAVYRNGILHLSSVELCIWDIDQDITGLGNRSFCFSGRLFGFWSLGFRSLGLKSLGGGFFSFRLFGFWNLGSRFFGFRCFCRRFFSDNGLCQCCFYSGDHTVGRAGRTAYDIYISRICFCHFGNQTWFAASAV